MASAAGGTSHRLNPGFAMMRSLDSNPAITSLPGCKFESSGSAGHICWKLGKVQTTPTQGQSALHDCNAPLVPNGRSDAGVCGNRVRRADSECSCTILPNSTHLA